MTPAQRRLLSSADHEEAMLRDWKRTKHTLKVRNQFNINSSKKNVGETSSSSSSISKKKMLRKSKLSPSRANKSGSKQKDGSMTFVILAPLIFY